QLNLRRAHAVAQAVGAACNAVSLRIDQKQRDAGGIVPLPADAGADDQFAGAVALCDDTLCAVDDPAAPLPLRSRQHIGKIVARLPLAMGEGDGELALGDL